MADVPRRIPKSTFHCADPSHGEEQAVLTPSWDPRPGHLWVRWTCPAGHVTESVYLILEWRFQFWVPKTHVDMFKASWGRAKQMMTAGQ